jgi:hypothetical protein
MIGGDGDDDSGGGGDAGNGSGGNDGGVGPSAGVARRQVHQKAHLAVAVSKLLTGARMKFVFTLKSRFCHRELLWFWKWNF